MNLYTTNEYKGHGKNNYFWYEYRKKGNKITKNRCSRTKIFDGHENEWVRDESEVDSWNIKDSGLPGWLRDLIK